LLGRGCAGSQRRDGAFRLSVNETAMWPPGSDPATSLRQP